MGKIYDTWRAMISRCYNKKDNSYSRYGKRFVTVDESWYNFSVFFYDFINLNGYNEKDFLSGKISLDKDKKQYGNHNKVYSKETCCLLSYKEQSNYLSTTKTFIAIHPNGKETIEHNASKFARTYNLQKTNICQCLKNERKSHKGYKFKSI